MAWFWFIEWLILVYIINRIIHGRLEIWNLSSRVHIRYLTRSLRSLVRYRCEHSKINSISPRDHVLFSIYYIDTSVLLENTPLVKFIRNYIRHRWFHWYQVCLLNCTSIRWCMIETSSGLPRKSSAMFGNELSTSNIFIIICFYICIVSCFFMLTWL